MEKKRLLFVFVLMAIMLVMATGCTSVTGTETPAGTPAPGGQINLPGLSISIQVYSPGPNPLVDTLNSQDRVASVLLGIWHGFISPVTLVISFFNKDVQMYEVHNDGSLYNLGFFLGVAIVFIILGALIGGSPRRAH